MNERIEHLLYLSGLTASGCWDKFDDYDKDALNKFSELIVQECCRALNPMLRDMISRGQGVESIKKHFGVEE